MSKLDELGKLDAEFDAMFWKHRVPRNTKQSKDIKSFARKYYDLGKFEGEKEIKYRAAHWHIGKHLKPCICATCIKVRGKDLLPRESARIAFEKGRLEEREAMKKVMEELKNKYGGIEGYHGLGYLDAFKDLLSTLE